MPAGGAGESGREGDHADPGHAGADGDGDYQGGGGQLLDQVKWLLHEGNVRRIVVKQGADTVVEFPLTVGMVGAVLAPALAAVGAVAALVTDCTIEVERADVPPMSTEAEEAAERPPPDM